MLADRARVLSAAAAAEAGGAEAAVEAPTADDATGVAGKIWKPDFQMERGCDNTSRVRSKSCVGYLTSVMLLHVITVHTSSIQGTNLVLPHTQLYV